MAHTLQGASRMRSVLALGLVLAVSHSARAESDRGYGYQIAAVDAGALGVLALTPYVPGVSFETSAKLSLGTFVLGGAVVHAVHGEPLRSAGSIGLRIALPLAGLLVGDLVHQAGNPGDPHLWEEFDGPPSPWWLLGGVGGLVAASIVDARVLAGGYRPRRTPDWTPTVTAKSDGVAFGVGRAF